jgi:hypothetical protein
VREPVVVSQEAPKRGRARRAGSSPDLIGATRAGIEARLREIRPLVAEVPRLERALAALKAIAKQPQPQPATRGAGRRRRPGRRRGRRSAGTRSEQFLALVRDRPGVTIPEAAKAIGAAPTSLYRIAATLEREGTVRREGRGFVAPGTDGPAAAEQPGEGAPPSTGVAVSLPESGT